ncbi:MAG TPA: hypothetical protein IAB23_10180 [Candidatus Scybalocola faecavium]|nr:hypothetical protein [Candidatus Scybalocola faecavium]
MIRWRRPLYIDESIKESPAGIRYRFKFKKYPGDYYFIILPAGRDMPEIIRCIYLKQSWYKSVDYDILGVASGKNKAFELFEKMAADAYQATGDVNIRRFADMNQKKAF